MERLAQRWEENMKLKNIGYAVVIAATAAAFVIGSIGPSEAKHKKKEAAPAPATCWLIAPAPVCGARGHMKFTYINACYAAKDGATSVSPGPCKAAKGHMK